LKNDEPLKAKLFANVSPVMKTRYSSDLQILPSILP